MSTKTLTGQEYPDLEVTKNPFYNNNVTFLKTFQYITCDFRPT